MHTANITKSARELASRSASSVLVTAKNDGNPMSNYAKAIKLQQLNPDLKLTVLTTNIKAAESHQPQPSIIDDLDDDDLV